ncbi:hypothetical protein [Streptomyces ficellus]|uniref:Uncharacterized protein n=1 Tax=Streptomyces ficellus TaxID=1977088 RepID=A0A6I6FGR1_9ACTN|nr:hypothetical protein [Streptomyces ficellus]QGV77699.1 hypothetical protein EIZ62_05145 [Streptomyces ficellus]
MTSIAALALAARRAVPVTLLVLAALLGVTAAAGPACGAEPRPAAPAAPAAPDPDLTEAEAAAPHRAGRRHRRAVRPGSPRPYRTRTAPPPRTAGPAAGHPSVRTVRCVVLRC